MGRAGLSRRVEELDGEAGCKILCRIRRASSAPGAVGGWRRVIGLLLLLGGEMMHTEMSSTALWLMLLLGAYHGVNPGMGWLFAVALGMQERRGSAVAKSLVPIALGHALSIGIVVLAAAFLGMALPQETIRYFVAALLFGLGIFSLLRH